MELEQDLLTIARSRAGDTGLSMARWPDCGSGRRISFG
jgi:hypothetical protein